MLGMLWEKIEANTYCSINYLHLERKEETQTPFSTSLAMSKWIIGSTCEIMHALKVMLLLLEKRILHIVRELDS